MDVLTMVLLVGFAARLARLLVVDTITDPLRQLILRVGFAVAGERGLSWATSLVSCPFCLGFWSSAAVLGSWLAWGHTDGWLIVAGLFTLNYVQGHLNRVLDA